MIANLRPESLGLLDCVVEECDERFGAERQDEILGIVGDVLGREGEGEGEGGEGVDGDGMNGSGREGEGGGGEGIDGIDGGGGREDGGM